MSGAEAIVGVVSGGAGLLSLSIQLLDSAKQLKAFCDDVKNAPEMLEMTVFGLETMAGALEQIEHQIQNGETAQQNLVKRCLKTCRSIVARIVDTAVKMQRYMSKFRMGKFLVAFKKDGLDDLLKELDRARSSLHLVLNIYYDEDRRIRESRLRNEILSSQGTLVERLCHELRITSGNISQQTAERMAVLLINKANPKDSDERSIVSSHSNLHQLGGEIVDKEIASSSRAARQAKRFTGKQTTWFHRQLVLPRWLSSCVWDVAIVQADSGWKACLQGYNIRPSYEEVFKLCEQGDIKGVDRVIRSGQGSFLDRTESCRFGGSQTLLQIAANHRQLEMCEYLLDSAPWPDTQEAISNSRPERTTYYSKVNSFDDRFTILAIERYNYEFDVGQLANLNFAEFQTMRTLLRHLPLPPHPSPELENLRLAMLKRLSPREVSSLFDVNIWNPNLPHIKDQEGWSALHLVAFQLFFGIVNERDFSAELLTEWEEFGKHLIRNGAQLHDSQLHDPRMSPLFYGASHLDMAGARLDDCERFMQLWSKVLCGAGVDLLQYGRKEHILWENHICRWKTHGLFFEHQSDAWGLPCDGSMYQMKFGSTPNDWGVRYRWVATIPRYQLHHLPGAFTHSYILPQKILWAPTKEENVEGQWVKEGDHCVASIATYEGYEPQPERLIMRDLMNTTQDDTSVVPLLMSRRLTRTVRRSTSQPPPLQRRKREHYDWLSFFHPWLETCHLCPFDGKYRFGCSTEGQICVRNCVHGLGDPGIDDLFHVDVLIDTLRDMADSR